MIKQGLVLTCAKCSTKNFLDPYPFWNFSGNTKCAGCDTLYAVTFVKGQQTERTHGFLREGRPAAGLRRGQERRRDHR